MAADWIHEVRGASVAALAPLLGMSAKGWNGRTLSPCPACHEHSRGKGDKRGPVGMTRNQTGWKCHRCGVQGDGIALVAWVVVGRSHRDLTSEGWQALRGWFADQGLCDPEEGAPPPRRPRRPVPKPMPTTIERPPVSELKRLIAACVPLNDAPGLKAWLESRSIDPVALTQTRPSTLYALPRKAAVPPWAFIGKRPWPDVGFVGVVLLWDSRGRVRSVRARSTRPDGRVKEVAPRGYDARGLVMACPRGGLLLRGGLKQGPNWDGRAVIVEGVPDFLTWVSQTSGDVPGPAIFGVTSGSWTPEHGQAIPTGASVFIRTHHDKDGDRYAREVAATLTHCRLFRSRPYEG